jgi:hypothetical protein
VVAGVVSGAYHGLIRSGPFNFLLPCGLRPRLVCFSAREGAILKLLMGRQTVGRYNYLLQEWYIQPPFRLFVNERALPDLESKIPHVQ